MYLTSFFLFILASFATERPPSAGTCASKLVTERWFNAQIAGGARHGPLRRLALRGAAHLLSPRLPAAGLYRATVNLIAAPVGVTDWLRTTLTQLPALEDAEYLVFVTHVTPDETLRRRGVFIVAQRTVAWSQADDTLHFVTAADWPEFSRELEWLDGPLRMHDGAVATLHIRSGIQRTNVTLWTREHILTATGRRGHLTSANAASLSTIASSITKLMVEHLP